MADKEKTRYSDAELAEFKELIEQKIESARKELKFLQDQINTSSESSIGGDFKFGGVEDGAATQEKEYLNQMAARQMKFVDHLEKALERIANKTYGICRETGKLISKERLKAVPHATLSIEAKNAQNKN
ncbi:MAG: TraR/DksA C4-type zinc finger protein [Chitinophagales bacterium]